MRVFSDTTIIRSHVLISGFIDNYMFWNKHGEEAPPPRENQFKEILQDPQFNILFDDFDDACGDDEDVSGGYCDGLDGVPIDIGSDDDSDELDDGDFLNQLLQHTEAQLLVDSAKGIENFEMVMKSAEENIYERSKGCPKHWTVLRFVLELLTLKAKHNWSDSSFSYILAMLAWLLLKPNKVPANTYREKKLVSPFTMGVERIHACLNHCILYRGDTFKDLDKCPVCSSNRYKNNAGYYGGDNRGPTDRNKRKRQGASVEPPDTTLGISQKQRRIPAMVMWYLPVADRLRCFFSIPKDAELMC